MNRARLRLRAALATLLAGVALLPIVVLPAVPAGAALAIAVLLSVVLTRRLLPVAVPVRPSRRS